MIDVTSATLQLTAGIKFPVRDPPLIGVTSAPVGHSATAEKEEEEWGVKYREESLVWLRSQLHICGGLTVPGTVASACTTSHNPA